MQFNAEKVKAFVSEFSILEETLRALKSKMTEIEALEYIFNYSCAYCGKVDENIKTCTYRNSTKQFKLCEECITYINGY